MARKIIVITGPTATGKTQLAVALALMTGGEVVGADSMQIYRGMDIGTAKPTAAEMRGVPHHMLDVASPLESYSVARYVREAAACVEGVLARGRLPIVAGGTGLYIDSLVSGRSFAAGERSDALRREIAAEYDALGGETMHRRLAEFDPESAAAVHANDRKRIIRAIEVYRATGETLSAHNEETRRQAPRYDACRIVLSFQNRADLYARINARVDGMLEAGLVREVQTLLDSGVSRAATAMQAIGYKEIARALGGECTVSDAAEQIKRESRRYAKRQLSWLRRDEGAHWICWGAQPDFDAGLRNSTQFLGKYGILKSS